MRSGPGDELGLLLLWDGGSCVAPTALEGFGNWDAALTHWANLCRAAGAGLWLARGTDVKHKEVVGMKGDAAAGIEIESVPRSLRSEPQKARLSGRDDRMVVGAHFAPACRAGRQKARRMAHPLGPRVNRHELGGRRNEET